MPLADGAEPRAAMSTGFSFGTGALGSTTVAAGGTATGGGFSFGTGSSR